jgi:hypothetical protein
MHGAHNLLLEEKSCEELYDAGETERSAERRHSPNLHGQSLLAVSHVQ